MSKPLDLLTDWHTHTSQTDGKASASAMVGAAQQAGVTELHITDHVRESTTWLPEYVAELRALRQSGPIDIVIGIEAKMLDVRGKIDVPTDLTGIEQVIISDHQFPTRNGPVTPDEMERRIIAGEVMASDAVADLVLATSRAVFGYDNVIVGHLFSVLPKAGISFDEVTSDMLDTLAASVREAGAMIEVNEKWATPSLEFVEALCARGVDLVPSSDAHEPGSIAAWDHVAAAAEAIVHP